MKSFIDFFSEGVVLGWLFLTTPIGALIAFCAVLEIADQMGVPLPSEWQPPTKTKSLAEQNKR